MGGHGAVGAGGDQGAKEFGGILLALQAVAGGLLWQVLGCRSLNPLAFDRFAGGTWPLETALG
jgi:hypothetical protein